MSKTVVMLVRGEDDYGAMTFEQSLNEEQVYKKMVEEGVTVKYLIVDDAEVTVTLHTFDKVDSDFIAFIHNEFIDYDDAKHKNFYVVDEIKPEFVIYKNEHFEEAEALYDLTSKKVILSGDYYHDKIGYRISGYLQAHGIDEDNVEEIWIDETHELFDKLDFME